MAKTDELVFRTPSDLKKKDQAENPPVPEACEVLAADLTSDQQSVDPLSRPINIMGHLWSPADSAETPIGYAWAIEFASSYTDVDDL